MFNKIGGFGLVFVLWCLMFLIDVKIVYYDCLVDFFLFGFCGGVIYVFWYEYIVFLIVFWCEYDLVLLVSCY